MNKIYLLPLLLILIYPAGAISYSGCVGDDYDYPNHPGCYPNIPSGYIHVRMLGLTCEISIPTAGEYKFYVTNLDPDFTNISAYKKGSIERGLNTLKFTVDVPSGGLTVRLEPIEECFDPDDFWFVTGGDNRPFPCFNEQPDVFKQTVEQINVVNPLFVNNAGDLVGGSGIMDNWPTLPCPVTDTMYEKYCEVIDDGRQFWASPIGNHDTCRNWWDDEYVGEEKYKKWIGPLWYSFDVGNTHFVVIDSYEDGACGWCTWDPFARANGYIYNEPRNQFDWINSDLGSATAQAKTHRIVTFHHPVTGRGFIDPDNARDVINMFKANDVSLILVGHDHVYRYEYADGIPQIVSGGFGADSSGFLHWTLVHVKGNTITHTVYEQDKFGTTLTISGRNDGTSDDVTQTVSNYGSYNLPWVRLKYRMMVPYGNATYVAYSYTLQRELPICCHYFDDQVSCYVTISVRRGQSVDVRVYIPEEIEVAATRFFSEVLKGMKNLLGLGNILLDKILSSGKLGEIAESYWGYDYWKMREEIHLFNYTEKQDVYNMTNATIEQLEEILGPPNASYGITYWLNQTIPALDTQAGYRFLDRLLTFGRTYVEFYAEMMRRIQDVFPWS
jgi:hypothetical protein